MKSITIISKNSNHESQTFIFKNKSLQQLNPKIKAKSNEKSKQTLNTIGLISKMRIKTLEASKSKDHQKIYTSLSINAAPTSARSTRSSKKRIGMLNSSHLKQSKQDINHRSDLKLKKNWLQNVSISPLKQRVFQNIPRVTVATSLKYRKQISIIISVDFILNQFNFWGDQPIDEHCYKIWNRITSSANLIWTVRCHRSVKKLFEYSKKYKLHLDGILMIESHGKFSMKLSMAAFQQQMKLQSNSKLLIINSLRALRTYQMQPYQFKNSLPLISHVSTFIHFIKIDINDIERFKLVYKIINSDLPDIFNIQAILDLCIPNKSAKNLEENQSLLQKQSQQIKITQQAQSTFLKAKINIRTYFSQVHGGLNQKIQDNSLHFIIGDALRRNIGICKSMFQYNNRYQLYKERNRLISNNKKYEQEYVKKKNQYNRSVYIWDF